MMAAAAPPRERHESVPPHLARGLGGSLDGGLVPPPGHGLELARAQHGAALGARDGREVPVPPRRERRERRLAGGGGATGGSDGRRDGLVRVSVIRELLARYGEGLASEGWRVERRGPPGELEKRPALGTLHLKGTVRNLGVVDQELVRALRAGSLHSVTSRSRCPNPWYPAPPRGDRHRPHVAAARLEAQLEVRAVGGVRKRHLAVDDALVDELLELAVEGLHPFEGTVAHGVRQALALALPLADVLPGPRVGTEDLADGDAPAADLAGRGAGSRST